MNKLLGNLVFLILVMAIIISSKLSKGTKPGLRIVLVRHAETDANVSKRNQKQIYTPLNRHGIKQAELLGTYFRNESFTRIFTSSVIRAYQTFGLVLSKLNKKDINITITDDFYRKMIGNKFEPDMLQYPRIVQFFTDICAIADSNLEIGAEYLLVITHERWLHKLMNYITKSKEFTITSEFNLDLLTRRRYHNTGITELVIYPSKKSFKVHMVRYNAIPHLIKNKVKSRIEL